VLHNNAQPHVARSVQDILSAMYWKVLNHPPYSPDLSPCVQPLKKC
jgi:hypothetical protein